ncbi:MAG TPA: acetylxylan esterase [Isosphaeraceae bacterium]
MRRIGLSALALIALAATTRADNLDVLPREPGDPRPAKRLDVYLQAQAKVHFDARRAAVAAMKTPEDVGRRQAALKTAFREALGDLPSEKTPLNARVVGRDRRDGYSVERVVYESRPGHHVTANLYLPDAPPPFPGVLVPCGHSENGKAAETYQRMSILLARNGMAALCYDPIGQGERVQWLDDEGKPAIKGSTTEHTLLGIGALLVGRSAAGYRVWDGIRSLDYLASRPEIDPKRLGCTGNSGGGTETAYLMALDDRIVAAAPSCYITSLERLFATIGPQDAEQNVTGQVALGIEHADFVTMRAPRPTLLSVGTRDFFDIQGSWDTFREVKRIYCGLGAGERIDLFESDEPHGFTRPRRESCMRWMRRWLLGKDDAPVETDLPIAADRDLQCTETGQVLTSFHGKSAFDLNAEAAAMLAESRAGLCVNQTADRLTGEIRKRLALPAKPSGVIVHRRDPVAREGYSISRWAFETEPGVLVPVLLFRAEPGADGPLVVYVGADRAIAAPGGPIEARVKAGEHVALVEPRGMGEGSPDARPGPFGPDLREAFLALHLNRPLLGQRVFDVLQALRGLEGAAGMPVHLVGIGPGGPIVLHAALFADPVQSVTVERSIPSWSTVARGKYAKGDLAGVVPGVLASCDLPDLASVLAPARLTIRAPVDAAGGAVAQDVLDAAYAPCRAAYAVRGAGDKLTLRAGR